MNVGYIITIALVGFIVALEITKKIIIKVKSRKEKKQIKTN